MFNKKMERSTKEETHGSNNIIGKGTVIEGSMETSGNLRIEGKVMGNVKSKSKIVIGKSAYIDGNIMSNNVEVSGEVKGLVKVAGLLTLRDSAVVHGEIVAKELVIEPGAKFEGQCKMNQNVNGLEISKKAQEGKAKVEKLKNQLNMVNAV